MTWLARHRLAAGLRRLGHRPEWDQLSGGEPYLWCRSCDHCWLEPADGAVTRRTLRRAGTCRGRRQ